MLILLFAGEFVSLAKGVGVEGATKLSESELRDIEAVEKLIEDSAGKAHNPSALAACTCTSCGLRRLGGMSIGAVVGVSSFLAFRPRLSLRRI